MITFEMISAAVYSLLGLSALVVALTQVFKNWSAKFDWYKKVKEAGKKWADHMLSFIASFIGTGIVFAVGMYFNIGIFAAFCVSCVSSWLGLAGIVVGCAGMSNGWWSYEFMQKILEWIKLLPMPTFMKKANKHNCEADEN